MSRFKKATRKQLKLRMALDGPSGSGKTLTSLRFAFALGKRVAVIDTENRSASKYQGDSPDGITFDFDVLELANYAPTEYTAAIIEAGREGYDVLLIDSLTHAWAGEGGALDIKDKQGGNSFTAWAKVTPMHRRMIDAILSSPCHVLATMRSKTDYVLEETTDEHGRKRSIPRKIGMAPIQRDGMEYEFDVYGSMDWAHTLTITKSRCQSLADAIAVKPGASFMEPVIHWLETGEVVRPSEAKPDSIPAYGISEDQLAAIETLLVQGKFPRDRALTKLQEKYGVADFGLLTATAAEEIIGQLKAKVSVPVPQSNGK